MQTSEEKPIGVIEAMTGGFELIRQNPWIVVIPILLDLFIWLGPPISAQPVFDQLLAQLNAYAVFPPNTPGETVQNLESLKSMLQEVAKVFNANGIITTGLPTLFWVVPPDIGGARAPWFRLGNGVEFIAALLPLGIIGALITALYFELIGRAVRNDTNWRNLFPRVLKGWSRILVLLLILTLGVIGLMIPVSIGATALSFLNQGLASFVILIASLALVWAMLYLVFALPAIFVSGSNAWQAIFDSVSLFRFDLWSTVGLVILTYLIRMGFTLVWQFFADNSWGLLFDVIANAFLGSGLTAAMLVYYADRTEWLNRLRERIRQHMQAKG